MGTSMGMRDMMSLLPAPIQAGRRNIASHAIAAPTAPEDRVRGRTAAHDLCQKAAETTPSSQDSQDVSVSPRANETGAADFGYPRNFSEMYRTDKELGRGANGVVTNVTHLGSARSFACKSIPKAPEAVRGDEKKQVEHLKAIRREIKVMKMMRSCLNVAKLEEVFEDEASVHIVMELCTGGELAHSVGTRHYSERTVASYMRAVLKTLAQCHAHHILHRDVKPGNFLLESEAGDARIKAIDFGLAVPFEEGDDLTNLDMQGTPWFLAPEALSSQWSLGTDVWAAGVCAFQLLTGRLPFNDRRNPQNPVLSAVLRAILTEPLDFERSYWQGISDEAKDFVAALLDRDPTARPSAAEALNHPWLRGDVTDRQRGAPLPLHVVQRIQRFGRAGLLKRSLLELMASELADDDLAPDANYCKIDEKARPVMDSPRACAMALVLRYLRLDDAAAVSRETVADGLQRMGYRLRPGELERLCSTIAGSGDMLTRAAVIASQIDWRYMQRHQKARWLAIARRAFDNLDTDGCGAVSVDQMIAAMQDKIPEDEVQALYEEVVARTGGRGRAIGFESFMAMLRHPSADSLDLYDECQDGSVSTLRTATATSRSHQYLSGMMSSPHASANGNALSVSPGAGGLAASCAVDALRESSVRGDASTHRGRSLATVLESDGS